MMSMSAAICYVPSHDHQGDRGLSDFCGDMLQNYGQKLGGIELCSHNLCCLGYPM